MKTLIAKGLDGEKFPDVQHLWLIEDAENWAPRQVLVGPLTQDEAVAVADLLRPRRRWRLIAMSKPL